MGSFPETCIDPVTLTAVEPLLTATFFCLGGQIIHTLTPLYKALYTGHLFIKATLICPQGGSCGEVQNVLFGKDLQLSLLPWVTIQLPSVVMLSYTLQRV